MRDREAPPMPERAGSSMPGLETRWPCPVCLGVKLEKTRVGGDVRSGGGVRDGVLLDHCPRCGGMWFELGEVQSLRREDPAALWKAVERREGRHRAQCHACRAHVDRDADRCPACGAKTRLDCPHCQERMRTVRHEDLILDVCPRCKGVWFDHHELSSIWELERDKLVARRRADAGGRAGGEDGSLMLVDALVWAPDLVLYGGYFATRAAAEGLAAAPSALEGAAETAGEAAASVFEVIVEIIGSIFS